MKRSSLIPIGAAPLLVAALAGCGSAGSAYGNNATAASTPPTAAAAAKGRALAVHSTSLGKILVDSKGMTLYYFEKDKKGSGKSACSGACASAWPPLTTSEAAKVMGGAQVSQLGTIKRSDGTTQVTYASWPLYTFVEDKKPGEDNGTDSKAFGASWYPLHPNGEKAGH